MSLIGKLQRARHRATHAHLAALMAYDDARAAAGKLPSRSARLAVWQANAERTAAEDHANRCHFLLLRAYERDNANQRRRAEAAWLAAQPRQADLFEAA